MERRFHRVVRIGVLAALYFCAGKIGLELAEVGPLVAPVWPPAGIALAALLLGGYRLWPGVFIGAFLVDITTQGSLAASLVIAAGNTLQALAGVWLVNRFASGRQVFERTGTVFRFVVFAAICSTILGASIGVTALGFGGYIHWDQGPTIWLSWWLAHMVSDLLVAPMLVILMTGPRFRWEAKRILESTELLLIIVLIGQIVFLQRTPYEPTRKLEYLCLPPLLWATFRFGGLGAIGATFLTSVIALYGTLRGLGPFAMPDRNQSLILLQLFIGVIMMTVLVLNAVILERRKAEQRLRIQDEAGVMLTESAAPVEAIPGILQLICEVEKWDVGVIWKVNATNELMCVHFCHRPSLKASELEGVTRQSTLSRGAGLPGRAWSSGKMEWDSDLARDGKSPRTTAALKTGLRSAFGFPIRCADEILAVLECFSQQVRRLDHGLEQTLTLIARRVEHLTERKRADEGLRESESRFRQTAQNIHGVFWMTDARKKDMLYVSPAYEEIWGRSCASLYAVRQSWIEAIHPDDRESVREAALTKQIPGQYSEVYRIIRPDGSLRWIHDRAFPVRDESGMVYRIAGIAEDITEQKLAENNLATLAQAFESTDELIGIADPQQRFTFVNRAFQQTYGYPEREVLGKTSEFVLSPNNPPDLVAEVLEESCLKGWQGELLNRRKDQTDFPVFLSTSPIKKPGGHVIGLVWVARDITEQKQFEKEILQISTRERQRIGYDLHDGLCQHLAGVAFKTKLLEDSLRNDGNARDAAHEIVELVNDAMRQTRQ
ncbi:MAG TPA: MASE1 domain-containing protein, partial [Verrucomicrobiae bacterium]|nr:MASE1 domain-containing protein [Verrucomicrobiae bacterium]